MVQPGPPTCPACGRPVAPHHRFCEHCGAPQAAGQPASPGAGPAAGPDGSRRRALVAVAVAVVLVAVAVVVGLTLGGDDPVAQRTAPGSSATPGSATSPSTSSPSSTSAPSPSAPSPSAPAGDTVACEYLPSDAGAVTDVGTPPAPDATPATGTAELVMTTGQGDLTLTLDRAAAPCAAASFVFLAEQGFFDGSPCHREVDQPGFGVLQCGDPSGTGTGGPAYRFDQEVTPATEYPRGTIAMANSGSPGSTGSQFFLCFVDTVLSPDYSVVGTVDDAGLAVLDGIAAAGNDGSFEPSPGGGAPNVPVTIESMTVAG